MQSDPGAIVLQRHVTLDEAVLDAVETFPNGCNYALYFEGDTVSIGHGCFGVLINLQTGNRKLLHDWFASQHKHGDRTPAGFHVPLPVHPATILELRKRRPCLMCGQPYFRATEARSDD